MPKVSEDHRAGRRRQIAGAALRCFSRKGFEGTSMSDIIAESGLSAGAIYLHYANKQDLVAAVIGEVVAARSVDLAELSARTPLPPPVEVLRTFLDEMTGEAGGAPMLVQVWAIAAREPSLAQVVMGVVGELRGLYVQYFTAWFAAHGLAVTDAAARAEAIAPAVIGLCQGYILQTALLPDFDPDRYLAAVAHLDFAP